MLLASIVRRYNEYVSTRVDEVSTTRVRYDSVIHIRIRVPMPGALVWRRCFLERALGDLPDVHLIFNHVCVRSSS